jgi:hypothetical protein
MAGRTRTTKKLAQRIDRNYFKNRFPFTRWRFNLSVLLTGIGVLWLAWHAVARNPSPYTSGPISVRHAIFSDNCAACHVRNGVFAESVTDQACSTCHNGPVHRAQQTFVPECTSCHLEHKNAVLLTRTTDKACTQCHADLKARDGKLNVAAHIDNFNSSHPEFAALRAGEADPGTIKFNHQVHLKKGLRGPTGNVDLTCDNCHRPTGQMRPWPYGKSEDAQPVSLAIETAPHSRRSGRSYMEPVNYYKHCSACHSLQFDKRISEVAPHVKSEQVVQFMDKKLREYIAAHPGDISLPDENEGRIPPRVPPNPARNADEWVQRRMAQAQQLLWGKSCKECHEMKFPAPQSNPDVDKANIAVRWLKKGDFDHQAHQFVMCNECHPKASSSKLTSDILLPNVRTCQACHHPGNQRAAQSSCAECHQYHDWKQEQHVDPKFTVKQLIAGLR